MQRLLLSLLVTLVALCGASPSHAQWDSTSVLFDIRNSNVGGSMIYQHGNLWAGVNKLFLSTDLGNTWLDRTPSGAASNSYVMDIDFINSTTGIVVYDNSRAFKTTDGGLNWRMLNAPIIPWYTVQYAGDSNMVILGGGDLFRSTDGGITWDAVPRQGFYAHINYYRGDTLIAFSYSINDASAYFFSTDRGASWTQAGGRIDLDNYSIEADSSGNIIIMNEEFWTNWDFQAELLVSPDFGSTWVSTVQLPLPANARRPKFAGNFAAGNCGYFVQTGDSGVWRSTDKGYSWEKIGGPKGWPDNRSMVAVTDDILFVISTTGEICRTFNAGGFSLPAGSMALDVDASDTVLFARDTLLACNSVSRDIWLINHSCTTPALDRAEIVYPAGPPPTLPYELDPVDPTRLLPNTKLSLSFRPPAGGEWPAELRLTFSDGSVKTIRLAGKGRDRFSEVTGKIEGYAVDTIGSDVCLPLTITPHGVGQDVTVSVSYDPELRFAGAFSKSGVRLDPPSIPGMTIFTISEAQLLANEPGAYLCFENLTTFPKDRYAVRIDWVKSAQGDPDCAVQSTSDTTVYIEVPVDCGARYISRFMQGISPSVMIRKLPVSKALRITSSLGDDATVELIDVLGVKRFDGRWEKRVKEVFELPYGSYANGLYFITVRTATHEETQQVLLD
jgi:photosystem II stability/assembly factor-like uncharacterized protein